MNIEFLKFYILSSLFFLIGFIDDKYSLNEINKRYKVKNIMLHAYKIKFMINNIQYNFKAKYNKDFEEFLKRKF